MARMETNRSESTTITVRVHPDLKDQYEDALDGKNKSDDIREHMREVAEIDDARDDGLPEKKDLRKAFLALERIADTRNKVETDMAETSVSNKLNLPKDAIKGAIFQPLEETGHLEPCWGKIRLRRVYQPEENGTEATPPATQPNEGETA